MSTSPDLCIIGAGTLGTDLALYARRQGASVVLADRGEDEPGDAAQRALRLAALFESARRAEDIRRAANLGLGPSEFKLSAKQIAGRANRLVENRIRASAPEVLGANGVTVVRGAVSFIDARSLLVGDVTIKPRKILIAIGSESVVPDIAGLGESGAFTPDSILDNQRKLTHLVIIGSDAAAIEQAQLQRRLGAAVTLVPGGELLAGFDPEGVAMLLSVLASEGISVRKGARVVAVNRRSQGIGIEIEAPEGARDVLDASHILVSAGRKADLEALDIAKARLKPGDDPARPLLRGSLGATSSRNIRLAGAAAGADNWGTARAHGRAAIDILLGGRNAGVKVAIPCLVETEPAIAEIRSVASSGRSHSEETILRENLAENDRAAAMGVDQGLVKVALDSRGHILKATVVAPQASELAGVLALAMSDRLKLSDLADLPLPQPSLFSVFSRLAENHLALSGVSHEGRGRGALRRLLRP